MNERTKKIVLLTARIAVIAAACGVWAYFLYRYEYFKAAGAVDNIVGMLPLAFVVTFIGGLTALFFMKHSRRSAPVAVALAAIVALSAALFPIALRGNWWLNTTPVSAKGATDVDLTLYEPFAVGSQVATLDEQATLTLTEDLPIMDGATALYPFYAAFAQAVYAKDAYSAEKVQCTKTNKAYDQIIAGDVDVIFALGPSEKQKKAAEAAKADLQYTAIGREAFVFVVGKGNPTDSLTQQQIRNVFSGKTARWGTLGWREGGNILAFQRPEGSGSQTGLQSVMGDLPIQAPQPLPDKSILGENSLMKQISVEWQGVQPAIGYSYRFFANTMFANPDAKILQVDDIAPTPENIRNGSYPFVFDFYAITNGTPQGNTKLLIDWILSSQGQELIEKTGYVPIAAL